MYLKSLFLQGFKSFADKTTIEFAPGVTGIVGPNGCGKSNVVDAIRWVLGETSAKALRGGEMADVIFNGSEKRKPHGMAEVTLVMGDCEESLKVDFNEVAITRRVFRDGKSEYRINGTLCRLRDISELFMDTGIGRSSYSIMEQGKIDLLLSSKPEDRRSVFEEAAGITKSKKEKKEALRKLEFTEANLLRVSDVLQEQERRINSLKRQVAKARRFQTISTDLRILDTHFCHRNYVELTASRQKLGTSLASLESSRETLETELPGAESEVIDSRNLAQELEASLSSLRQEFSEKKNQLSSARSRVAFNNERKTELSERLLQTEADIAATRETLAEQETILAESKAAVDQLEQRLHARQTDLSTQEETAEKSAVIRAGLEKELREANKAGNATRNLIASAQARIESAQAQQEGNRERAKNLEDDRLKLEADLGVAREERDAAEAKLAAHKESLPSLEETSKEAQTNFQTARNGLDAARKSLDAANKELTRRSSRLEVLQNLVESGEGLKKGTQEVLKGLGDPDLVKPGLFGVLGARITAPDDYAVALEAVLGENFQAILVRDEALAEEILTRLRDQKKGQATLICKDLHSSSSQKKLLPDGASAWALELVTAPSEVAPILDRLLGEVLFVPDLATALSLRSELPEVTFVTPTGEITAPGGFFSGGSRGKAENSVLRRRNEILALEKEVAGFATAEEAERKNLADLEARLTGFRDEVDQTREAVQKHKVEESNLGGQLTLARREAESVQSKKEKLSWEIQDLEKRGESAAESRGTQEEALQTARARLEVLETAARRVESELEEATRREKDFSEQLAEARTALAVEKQARDSASSQQKPLADRIHELVEMNRRREGEVEKAQQRIRQGERENTELEASAADLSSEIGILEEGIDKKDESRPGLLRAIKEAEAAFSDLREKLDQTNRQMNREEVEATKLDLRLENLLETVRERHNLDLAVFETDPYELMGCVRRQEANARLKVSGDDENAGEAVEPTGVDDTDETPVLSSSEPDWSYVEAVVLELRRRLEGLGPVNVDAIEEFDELVERHQFTCDQHDDLAESKDKLLEIIEKINRESERLFVETFAAVSKNFTSMFKELFGAGSQASLHLSDESNPLECGIEVIARPPGKKLQSITLMSGGERSLTAVALLFSIYMVKPSPFCVLDELDAPLDESNIGRFLKVLDTFINQSQFIVVTHSKRTMQRADVMYGVTMEEFGVSKPVGMRLSAAEKPTEARSPAQKAALALDA